MAQKFISQGILRTDFGVNNQLIFAPKVSENITNGTFVPCIAFSCGHFVSLPLPPLLAFLDVFLMYIQVFFYSSLENLYSTIIDQKDMILK